MVVGGGGEEHREGSMVVGAGVREARAVEGEQEGEGGDKKEK